MGYFLRYFKETNNIEITLQKVFEKNKIDIWLEKINIELIHIITEYKNFVELQLETWDENKN